MSLEGTNGIGGDATAKAMTTTPSKTLVSLRSLLFASTVAELYSGVAFLFFPKLMSNPLQDPQIRGEWEGGPAAKASRLILGCCHASFGLLSGLSLLRLRREKITLPVLTTLGVLHGLLCVPIALRWGFSITQVPGLVSHALLGCGFISYAWRASSQVDTAAVAEEY